ncbi:hypothetical protein TD95_004144 [Thielaviopsis punctulata]|uniref:DNA-directed RNA polymerase n=1 Tax=Thielaviopsis punctulata TaxID=72032 RepID=A0A0F4ZFU7_9PEZI|nr:hypothetical protein TD95_004144 [Thielaviopsis punctulata]
MLLRPAHRAAMQRSSTLRMPQHWTRNSTMLRQSSSLSAPSAALNTAQASQRRQQLANALSNSQTSRSLATAIDSSHIYDPLAASPIISMPSPGSSQKLTELPQFDITNLLKPDDDIIPPPHRKRGEKHSLPTDTEDMIALFDACIQVQRFDRAALVLRRLGQTPDMHKPSLIYMHNMFLKANLEQLRSVPNLRQTEALHQWYELYIREAGLPNTPETIAYMLRASILSAKGLRLERLITRYMDMVPGELGLQVLSQEEILSAQDLAIITKTCPRYNFSETETEIDSETEPVAEASSDSAAETSKSAQNEVEESESTTDTTTTTDSYPELLATPQKGLGLKFLKETLGFFKNIPAELKIEDLTPEQRQEIQARMEKNSIDSAIRRWREEHKKLLSYGLNTSMTHHTMSSNMFEWHKALEERFIKEFKILESIDTKPVKEKTDMDRGSFSTLLLQTTPARLAATTIMGTINSISIMGVDRGATIISVCNSVSRLAEEDIKAYLQEQAKTESQRDYRRIKRERKVTQAANASAPSEPQPEIQPPKMIEAKKPELGWSPAMRVKVGAFLLSCLFDTAKITAVRKDPDTGKTIKQVQPAFIHSTQLRKGKKIGLVTANKEVIEIMKSEPQGDILAKHLPMLVPPKPWQGYEKGAYLEYRASLIRVKNDPDQKLLAKAASKRGDLYQISRGLDVLGQTAWKVNTKVLDVLTQAWNTGEAIANLPPLTPDFPTPPEPKDSSDTIARRNWIRTVKMIENEKSGLHSNRCFINFQLEIARAYRNQTFYFPHNIDFRGRAYPLPTYLNHMGADHVRGALQFAKGKELGRTGLRWLKIHLANVAGYDKASLDEREAFAEEHLEDIRDSARDPLGGNRWWLKSEDAWQTLAACFELTAALNSEDPTKYVSYLPVHQDGTCNGLQHYAALGGDMWGAKQVNLEPGDRPADVYTAVANLVNELVDEEALTGNEFAKSVQGKITRKVVKQTVMTNVYGVTFQGAKKQVAKQIDAYYPNIHKETGYSSIILASYIAAQIFKAMGTMFRGAHEIQSWLGEVGGRVCNSLTAQQVATIARDPTMIVGKGKKKKGASGFHDDIQTQFNSTIVWTTPLRLPVSQPYRKNSSRSISTCLQDIVLTDPNRNDPVDRRKQLQAFPPNFIHSLDASHMLLSALRCNEKNLEFAAVHDSFWTHACDVDEMSMVLRESFIDIHKEDVIGRLETEFRARYKNSMYLAKVDLSSSTGRKISAWRRETKSSLRDELCMEELRRQLLSSSDPEEVKKGQQMVTPATIVADSKDEGLMSPDGKEELAMGNIHSHDLDSEEDGDVDGGDSLGASESLGGDMDFTLEEREEMHADFKSRLKMSTFELAIKGDTGKMRLKKEPKRAARAAYAQVWLPLDFPAIPAKGEFDVTRLRDSQYFFS